MEFPWNHDNLPNEPAVHGPPIIITEEMICKVISQMRKGKATGPSEVMLEMILASQQHILPHLTKLVNNTEGKILEGWNLSHIINCFKGEGDPLVMGNYCKVKLPSHVMKIIEHVTESIIRSSFNINEMQSMFFLLFFIYLFFLPEPQFS